MKKSNIIISIIYIIAVILLWIFRIIDDYAIWVSFLVPAVCFGGGIFSAGFSLAGYILACILLKNEPQMLHLTVIILALSAGVVADIWRIFFKSRKGEVLKRTVLAFVAAGIYILYMFLTQFVFGMSLIEYIKSSPLFFVLPAATAFCMAALGRYLIAGGVITGAVLFGWMGGYFTIAFVLLLFPFMGAVAEQLIFSRKGLLKRFLIGLMGAASLYAGLLLILAAACILAGPWAEEFMGFFRGQIYFATAALAVFTATLYRKRILAASFLTGGILGFFISQLPFLRGEVMDIWLVVTFGIFPAAGIVLERVFCRRNQAVES